MKIFSFAGAASHVLFGIYGKQDLDKKKKKKKNQ